MFHNIKYVTEFFQANNPSCLIICQDKTPSNIAKLDYYELEKDFFLVATTVILILFILFHNNLSLQSDTSRRLRLFFIFLRGYVYSRAYVYSFWKNFKGLRLFPDPRLLFQTLDHIDFYSLYFRFNSWTFHGHSP